MKDGSEQLVNSISDSIVFVVEGLSELLKTGQYSDFNTSLQKDMDRFLKSPKQAYGEIKLEQLEKSGAKLESVSYDGDLLGFDKMAKESKLSYAICKVDKGDINSDEKSLHLIYFKKDDIDKIALLCDKYVEKSLAKKEIPLETQLKEAKKKADVHNKNIEKNKTSNMEQSL